jgi:hypothetical protein
MDKVIKRQDWYESVDEDVDFNEMNKVNIVPRPTLTVNKKK